MSDMTFRVFGKLLLLAAVAWVVVSLVGPWNSSQAYRSMEETHKELISKAIMVCRGQKDGTLQDAQLSDYLCSLARYNQLCDKLGIRYRNLLVSVDGEVISMPYTEEGSSSNVLAQQPDRGSSAEMGRIRLERMTSSL